MMAIILRTALPADRDAVVGLIQQLNVVEAELTGDRLRDHAAAAAYHDELSQRLAKRDGRVVVAVEDGEVIAAMGFVVQTDAAYMLEDVREYAVVTDLVVDARFRRRGIGRMLLREAERLAREAGLKRLTIAALVANERAERTYREFGFEPYVTIMTKAL
jgi:GNAT superfamily N-acetyltransferase